MAQTLAAQLAAVAHESQEPTLRVAVAYTQGESAYMFGDVVRGRLHLEHAVVLYDIQQHQDAVRLYGLDHGVATLGHLALVLGLLGWPAQAAQRRQAAVTLAQELAHPYSQAFALHFAALGHQV